jgi:hypothetical protein
MGCYLCQARCWATLTRPSRAAWLQDMFLSPDVLEWVLNVVVVRSAPKKHPERQPAFTRLKRPPAVVL